MKRTIEMLNICLVVHTHTHASIDGSDGNDGNGCDGDSEYVNDDNEDIDKALIVQYNI